MNNVHSTADTAPSTVGASVARWAGGISLLQGLIIFVPMIVLGGAINWPESLSDPAGHGCADSGRCGVCGRVNIVHSSTLADQVNVVNILG